MAEATLSEISKKLDGITATLGTHSKILDHHTKDLAKLKTSVAGTDAVVTALYAELVGNRPHLRDRLVTLEGNVSKLIELTPGAAAELKQPVYDS